MTSKIAVSRPYEVISIRHLGVIKDGVVDTTSSEAAGWAGCTETYSFADSGPWTVLTVEADSPPEFDEFMKQTWPKALARLKAICET